MRKRMEMLPFTAGVLISAYLTLDVQPDKLVYLVPYLFLTLTALKPKSFPYGASSLFAVGYLEWTLTQSPLSLAVIALSLLGLPIRIEKQPVKLWERVINVLFAGIVGYIALVSPEWTTRIVGAFGMVGMLSNNRSISSGGLVVSSSLFLSLPLGNFSDLDPNIFIALSALSLAYSLHHLRKLLR